MLSLSLLVTQVIKTYENESQDYDLDGSVDCGAMIAASWNLTREKMVTSAGFTNFDAFLAEVKNRTTEKFVYCNFH